MVRPADGRGWRLAGATCLAALSVALTPARAAMPPAVYPPGEPAAAGDIEVTVTAVARRPVAAACEVKAPCVLVTVSCTVRNISPGPVLVSALPTFDLIDPSGRSHEPVSDEIGPSGRDHAAVGSRLAPGGGISRRLSFQISADAFDQATWMLRVGGSLGPRIVLR